MNCVPRVNIVPGATWMRPAETCSSAGFMQRHAPSASRTKFVMNVSMAAGNLYAPHEISRQEKSCRKILTGI
jgi:hypothetical protein